MGVLHLHHQNVRTIRISWFAWFPLECVGSHQVLRLFSRSPKAWVIGVSNLCTRLFAVWASLDETATRPQWSPPLAHGLLNIDPSLPDGKGVIEKRQMNGNPPWCSGLHFLTAMLVTQVWNPGIWCQNLFKSVTEELRVQKDGWMMAFLLFFLLLSYLDYQCEVTAKLSR